MEKLKKQSVLVLIALLGIGLFSVSSCKKDDSTTVDKTALTAKLTEANDLYTNAVEGTAAGQCLWF